MDAIDTQMLITSADTLPGQEIQTLGHVFGLTVRSRNVGASFAAGLKSLVGGEISIMTKNFENSRKQAIDRMIGMAHQRGADAIVAFRFDSTSETGMSEVCAYGTAVKIIGVGGNKMTTTAMATQ